MTKQRLGIGLTLVLLLTAFVGSAAAQHIEPSKATLQPAIECGGQYSALKTGR